MAKNDKQNMGKTKRSTDDLINDAINKQNDWLENRREYTRGFLKSLNMFAKKSDKKSEKISSAAYVPAAGDKISAEEPCL